MAGVMVNHSATIIGLCIVILWPVKTVSCDGSRVIDGFRGNNKGMCDGLAWGFSSLTLILCIIIIFIMVKYCQAREFRRENGLYMQISMTDMLETIHLGGCLMALDQLYQEDTKAPLVRDIQVAIGWMGQVAIIKWGRRVYATQISGKELDEAMAIPARIMVSGRLARRLEAIPRGEVYIRLLRYNGEIATVLPRGKPMMTSSGWSQVGKRELEAVSHKSLRRNRERQPGGEKPTQIAIIKKDRANKPEPMVLVDLKEAKRGKMEAGVIYEELE